MSDDQAGTAGTWLGVERRWLTLIAVCGATFMLLVDITIVQVALPTIEHRLHASFSDLQWVIDAYALAMSTLILVWGSSADRFGRKHVFVVGLAVFTLASLLCGVATNAPMLIWSRALQGIGGAALFATGLALIGQEFHGSRAGHGDCGVGRDGRGCGRCWPAHRRRADERLRLAVDLLRQRSRRRSDRVARR